MKLLELFDAADPNACYRRRESIVPQQALALLNSSLVQDHARALAERLAGELPEGGADVDGAADRAFIAAAFETVLSRSPTPDEVQACLGFLDRNVAQLQQPNLATFPPGGGATRVPAADLRQRARENLLLVLYSHHEFVTVR